MNIIKESEKLELHKVLIKSIEKEYDEDRGCTTNRITVRLDKTDEQIVEDWMNNNNISPVNDTFVRYSDIEKNEELVRLRVNENTVFKESDGEKIVFNRLSPGFIVNITAHACPSEISPHYDLDSEGVCITDNIRIAN